MIRGKKNFLPPHPLVMGFGLLFRLDESSLGSHLNERRVRGEEEGGNDFEEAEFIRQEPDSESDDEEGSIIHSSKDPPKPKQSEDVSKSSQVDVAPSILPIEEKSTLNGVDTESAANPEFEDLIDRALRLGSTALPANKYNLAIPDEDSVVEEEKDEERKASEREKPYISKAERRKLKKGPKSNTEETLTDERDNNKVKQDEKSVGQLEKNVEKAKQGAGKVNRGQKGKLKKIKEKYADQDEEERNKMMALLAVSNLVHLFIVIFRNFGFIATICL